MDKLKSFMGSSEQKTGSSSTTGTAPQGQAQGEQKQDFFDKGLSAVEKKFGIAENRERDEKYGDQAREFIEKRTGKDIPDKVWN